MIALCAAAALTASAGAAFAAVQGMLHEEKSLYRNLFVSQEGDQRCLLFRARRNLGRESCMYLSNPDRFVFPYAKMMLSSLYLSPTPPKRVLIVGEGGGTLPIAIQGMLPNAKIDVVEIDAAVDRVARKYFNYKPNANTKVTIQDGRVFIKRAKKAAPYDLIMLDAFAEDYIPEHMLTREFLQEVDGILAPGGVLAANTWSSSDLYDHESATYSTVFGPFINLKGDNRIILTKKGGLPTQAEIARNAPAWEKAFARHGAGQGELLAMMSRTVDWDRSARILTDQYSPSNVLNATGRKAR